MVIHKTLVHILTQSTTASAREIEGERSKYMHGLGHSHVRSDPMQMCMRARHGDTEIQCEQTSPHRDVNFIIVLLVFFLVSLSSLLLIIVNLLIRIGCKCLFEDSILTYREQTNVDTRHLFVRMFQLQITIALCVELSARKEKWNMY